MFDNRCTTCITYGVVCTYFESSKVWAFFVSASSGCLTDRTSETHIPKVSDPLIYSRQCGSHEAASSYVRELENRLAQVEKLIREVCFDIFCLGLAFRLNFK